MASTMFVTKEYVRNLKTAMGHRQKKVRERAKIRLEQFHDTPLQEHRKLESEIRLNKRLGNNDVYMMTLRMRTLKEAIRGAVESAELGGADERYN
jgi:Tfp pilus assembly protein PilF